MVEMGRFTTQSWGASNSAVVKNTKTKTKKTTKLGGLCVFVFVQLISQQRMGSMPFDVRVLLLLQVRVGDERIRLSYDVEGFFHFL